MMATQKWISTAVGLLLLAASVPALAQSPAPGPNQRTADAVARALRANTNLTSSSKIAIESRSGLVTLSGVVPSADLKNEALFRAQQVPGVSGVIDRLAVGDARVMPAQFAEADPTLVALGHGHGHGHGGFGGEVIGAPVMMEGPVMDGAVGGISNGPLPEGPAGMAGATQAAAPGYPNYAWPSYAPHPNFSAVGYPTVYPWQAWPNIGPFYPYPEVPLGWRAVTLRWDDGLWWLDFKKHYSRPFFTPYPFGIFSY